MSHLVFWEFSSSTNLVQFHSSSTFYETKANTFRFWEYRLQTLITQGIFKREVSLETFWLS
ncbi:hypothetical protein FF021_08510 [Leptospira noguchii]|nr:hypothetical protein FF021_08510 [Leptospira noguchii]